MSVPSLLSHPWPDLQSFFRAGGEGLDNSVLEVPAYTNMIEQLRLIRYTTSEIMELYFRCQAEKALSKATAQKPSVSFTLRVSLDGTRLHINDKVRPPGEIWSLFSLVVGGLLSLACSADVTTQRIITISVHFHHR